MSTRNGKGNGKGNGKADKSPVEIVTIDRAVTDGYRTYLGEIFNENGSGSSPSMKNGKCVKQVEIVTIDRAVTDGYRTYLKKELSE